MATYWVPDLPNIKGISGHLWHSIFIFAHGASYTCSNKHINMLAWVCGLVWHFSSWKSLTYWNQVGEDWKEWVAMGTKCFVAEGVFAVELSAYQVSMVCAANWPRKLNLYAWCYIGLSVWRHQSSHLHILYIFQTYISPELKQVFANGKRRFHSFIEFFVIRVKNQEVKIGS